MRSIRKPSKRKLPCAAKLALKRQGCSVGRNNVVGWSYLSLSVFLASRDAATCNRLAAAVLPRSVSISTLLQCGPSNTLSLLRFGLCSGRHSTERDILFLHPEAQRLYKGYFFLRCTKTIVSAHHHDRDLSSRKYYNDSSCYLTPVGREGLLLRRG